MIIKVIAHPNSKKPRVTKDPQGLLHVYVSAPALEGRANQAVIESLAEYFRIKRYRITLLSGQHTKNKTFEIKELLLI